MRFVMLAFFACLLGLQNAAGQCPAQPRQASFDAAGKNVTIGYYNSGTHVVREVQFVLIAEDPEQRTRSVVGSFRAKGILRPKQERIAVFPNISASTFSGPMELKVKGVSFADGSVWAAPQDSKCRIQLSEIRAADKAQ
jgi:hypothetical protein